MPNFFSKNAFLFQHEVISLSEKVVLRAEDVISIMRSASGVKWDVGLQGVFEPNIEEVINVEEAAHYTSPLSQSLDIREVFKEKTVIGKLMALVYRNTNLEQSVYI